MADARDLAPRPAVDFDPLSQEFQRNPLPTLRRLREESPVFYSPTYDFFAITRNEDIKKALLDTDTFSQGELGSATVPEKYTDRIPQHFFAKSFTGMNPPEHTRYRKVGQSLLGMRNVAYLEEPLRDLANELIDDFAGDESADLIKQYFVRMTLGAMLALLGLPISEFDRMLRLAHDWVLMIQQQIVDLTGDELWEFYAGTRDQFREIVRQRRADPGDDFVSKLILARDEDGEPLFDDERIVTVMGELILGGTDTASNTMASAFLVMDHDDALRAQALANPDLFADIFEETLRINGPVTGVWKRAERDVEVHGVTIPKGAAVWMLLLAGSTDGRAYDNPEEFCPHRERPTSHLAFGFGRHLCVGAPLARLEGRVGLQVLYSRIPDIRLRPGTELKFQEMLIGRNLESLPAVWGSTAKQLV
ncbi:MAG: cytochrome P450 [Aeromicrobium sp.]